MGLLTDAEISSLTDEARGLKYKDNRRNVVSWCWRYLCMAGAVLFLLLAAVSVILIRIGTPFDAMHKWEFAGGAFLMGWCFLVLSVAAHAQWRAHCAKYVIRRLLDDPALLQAVSRHANQPSDGSDAATPGEGDEDGAE